MDRPRKPFRIESFTSGRAAASPGEGAAALVPHDAGRAAPRPASQPRDDDRNQRERAAIRAALAAGEGLRRAARELGEVVVDTAAATHAVLGATEEIETSIDRLRMLAGRGPASTVADEISEQTAALMQACGFQDLTGQRIATVVTLLHDMEMRLAALRQTFGAADVTHAIAAAPDEGGLENGPKLPSDIGHLTQAEIDRVFNDPSFFEALRRKAGG